MSARTLLFLLVSATVLAAPPDPLVVIVNAGSTVTQMSQEEVTNIFMGRQKRLPNGVLALPVEPVDDPKLRDHFYQLLMNVPLPQIRSYWARMFFSGQAQPPRQAPSSSEVIETVVLNKGAIGFVEQSKLDKRVKQVLVLKDPPPK